MTIVLSVVLPLVVNMVSLLVEYFVIQPLKNPARPREDATKPTAVSRKARSLSTSSWLRPTWGVIFISLGLLLLSFIRLTISSLDFSLGRDDGLLFRLPTSSSITGQNLAFALMIYILIASAYILLRSHRELQTYMQSVYRYPGAVKHVQGIQSKRNELMKKRDLTKQDWLWILVNNPPQPEAPTSPSGWIRYLGDKASVEVAIGILPVFLTYAWVHAFVEPIERRILADAICLFWASHWLAIAYFRPMLLLWTVTPSIAVLDSTALTSSPSSIPLQVGLAMWLIIGGAVFLAFIRRMRGWNVAGNNYRTATDPKESDKALATWGHLIIWPAHAFLLTEAGFATARVTWLLTALLGLLSYAGFTLMNHRMVTNERKGPFSRTWDGPWPPL